MKKKILLLSLFLTLLTKENKTSNGYWLIGCIAFLSFYSHFLGKSSNDKEVYKEGYEKGFKEGKEIKTIEENNLLLNNKNN
jgi:hypothetical protein